MNIADKIEVGWHEAFIAEHQDQLRHKIVRMVRAYCARTHTPYKEVWHTVYRRLEEVTGISYQDRKGAIIDKVEEQGHLPDLYEVVQNVCS